MLIYTFHAIWLGLQDPSQLLEIQKQSRLSREWMKIHEKEYDSLTIIKLFENTDPDIPVFLQKMFMMIKTDKIADALIWVNTPTEIVIDYLKSLCRKEKTDE